MISLFVLHEDRGLKFTVSQLNAEGDPVIPIERKRKREIA